MKKGTKVIIGIMLTVTVALITFRAIDHEPVNTLPLDKKVEAIVGNSGCNICHSRGQKLPWYSEVPLLNWKLKKDMKKGLEAADLSDLYKFDKLTQTFKDSSALLPPFADREEVLRKLSGIDQVLDNHSMPPMSFTILRPGSAINAKEREIMLQWNSIRRNEIQF